MQPTVEGVDVMEGSFVDGMKSKCDCDRTSKTLDSKHLSQLCETDNQNLARVMKES
jgi:hypothetical protein